MNQQLEHLFLSHHDGLLRLATAILGDADEANDAVSAVFERAVTGGLPCKGERLDNWLMVSVRNQCRDMIRKKQRTERLQRLYRIDDTDDGRSVQQQETRWKAIVLYAKREFSPQMWRVFSMRYGDMMPCKEIASQLEISQTAVYKHLANALKLLREHFKNLDYDE